MTIPLEEGFTVVTGPNGSGKSNILDGVLFCLGLATSRGMRAERLPDLVNSAVLRAGKSAETVVSVKFDLSDWHPDAAEEGLEIPEEGPWIKPGQKEWTVTRRLRVMPGGSYSSFYSADGESCNLQQLQTQLRRLRIDPEGSNVVMQGDVTRVVSMSNKDRRGLIDELAGVALFDNRIEQARLKLDDVFERQERCRIVEQELLSSKLRLEKDCEKARLYKQLKEQMQLGRKQESVLVFELAKKDLENLLLRQKDLIEKEARDQDFVIKFKEKVNESDKKLQTLQAEVKALGEDKLIAIQGEIAGLDSQARELERQAIQHKEEGEKLKLKRQDIKILQNEVRQDSLKKTKEFPQSTIDSAEKRVKDAQSAVEVSRRRLTDIAGRSGVWLEEYKERTDIRQKLQSKLKPLQEEQQKLQERLVQINERLEELRIDQDRDIIENQKLNKELEVLDDEWQSLLKLIVIQQEEIDKFVDELSIQQRTRLRLENEQTKVEKDIARLESRKETLHESRGTGALRLLLEAGLEGIHGPVAHLGEVKNEYRLALEVAAGARIGQIVVDDDLIAAKSIELLKRRKAGRLTFLPLNKIKNSSGSNKNVFKRPSIDENSNCNNGFIAKAIDLIEFDTIYKDVFRYVFGETFVFNDLHSARTQLGVSRSVTLAGELIEKSGAMTGGSFLGRSSALSFGSSDEKDDIEPLRQKLLEIGETLVQSKKEESRLISCLDQARPKLKSLEKKQTSLDAQRSAFKRSNGPFLTRHNEQKERLISLNKAKEEHQNRLDLIAESIKPFVNDLEIIDAKEKVPQADNSNSNIKELQEDLNSSEEVLERAKEERDDLLNQKRHEELALERLEGQQKSLSEEEERLQEAIDLLTKQHKKWKEENQNLQTHREKLDILKKTLETSFGEKRRARDAAELQLANFRQKFQDLTWKLERLQDDIKAIHEELRSGNIRIQELEKLLPDPLPEIPSLVREQGLEHLQNQLQNLQDRIESLEPVNMLALEELEKLDIRLKDLVERLEVLTEERSELLLRVETVATLRQEAFMEAFEAVDVHFREIFASLSDGDGHLQLENIENPLEGGLTLVAHPKGKAVRRLAAMSGGEKSLTALSFLFALQRFRPSPFYALDEVDSFLDGVNVERLSALIARQSESAQFMVVSHRRPMIGAATRTIGVTQARGANTQVVGLPLAA
ncbi:Chromosome segregation ATPase [Prochlorococcus sp. SS52]|uniref:Chromosome partition protein Smc n=2 Tax=Prochlorococcaceae TaxID=2881426 RepID=Q7VEE2_PROMA|nr:Chromosome segregation ATPase [Prochlorococcus marinus subsp. marinus str. CCMP1375]KGG11623.1 Chromosome segregation ATPase [Prochlorococcus marinus str. LG]KGG32874.1 Chromosome segregation ATPase [Prochlorococcus marinus str. SS51]KGG36569.1 Chromosome segregation ATPase [Prochlorococcus sp. SS52]